MLIHSRKSWGARAPRPSRSKQNATDVTEFFLHWPADGSQNRTTYTIEQEKAILRSFQNLHMDDPDHRWSDIGYNFAVFPSGRIYRLRGMDWVPAAQQGHNTNTVSCVCVGKLTKKMQASLVDLKNHCDNRAGRDLRVRGHGEVFGTECPGPQLRAFIPVLAKKA